MNSATRKHEQHEHRHDDDFPFSEGQRIYKRGTGIRGTFVFHNGHPAVRLDGDSYPTGLIVFEWQAE